MSTENGIFQRSVSLQMKWKWKKKTTKQKKLASLRMEKRINYPSTQRQIATHKVHTKINNSKVC
jgi:hypothetical protein